MHDATLRYQEVMFHGLAAQATRYAASMVRRWSDAEEIVQEAFCRLIQSGNSQQSDLTFDVDCRALLFTTVRNLAIDHLRVRQRRKFEAIDANQISMAKPDSDPQRLVQLERCIDEILDGMPTQWSESLQLKINGELSYAEIANVLGGTHAQVRSWIYRARKQLAVELTRRGILEGE